jgi:hypothetical protein
MERQRLELMTLLQTRASGLEMGDTMLRLSALIKYLSEDMRASEGEGGQEDPEDEGDES